ncbi:DUF1768-domain-containing protein [Heliocybe sulcata]|uniref:DUF1768-domain-containing protein n=1 Tax=Heliocybe sulcata TaxID=5364 RepID=A0A5C3MWC6_9AGAM|nr:DUF1768-domain-containing protein [Heliocybe sulcata]
MSVPVKTSVTTPNAASLTKLPDSSKGNQYSKTSRKSEPPASPPANGGFLMGILSAFGLGGLPRGSRTNDGKSGLKHQTGAIKFYQRGQPYYEFTNFAPYPVRYNQKDYPTCEHLFQSLKFDSQGDVDRIRSQATPRAALDEAKKLQGRVRKGWIEKRLNVKAMEQALLLKFTQHEQLKKMLLDTDDAKLIEDSPIDAFWGVGPNGQGGNELGKALEKVRSSLRRFESS